jgi:hypothetical protein
MSTQPAPATSAPALQKPVDEIRIISHSNLFYWWPVWAIGFLMGFVSLFSGFQMAAVPKETYKAKLTVDVQVWEIGKTEDGKEVETKKTEVEKGRYVLVAPKDTDEYLNSPGVTVSQLKTPGVLFCTVLMVVVLITNIHLRGLWSLIVIVIIVALVIILGLAGAWDWIFEQLHYLDIRISTGGYFLISIILLALWLIIFFLFDPQVYMVFTPGQFKVRLEIGEGETAYDTRGMTVHKVRSDFFRHWILGLGSGDLIVRTTGAQAHEFQLSNVLFISQKVKVIEDMVARAGR